MPASDPNNNIYNTHSQGDPVPEPEYAELELTKAKTVTRNRALTGVLLGGSGLAFALWFALIYRAPDRDRSEEDGVEFVPEMISLQDGVVAEAGGSTNSLISGFDVSSYLPDDWGELPNTDELSNPNIQVLNPVINSTEVKPSNLIIETNDVTTMLAQVAEQFIRAGKLDLAEDQLKIGLEQRPDDINCLDLLGSIYAIRGQHAKAISHYTDLIERNPYKEDYYNNLAVAYMRNGQLDEAEATLKEALKTNLKYYDAHVNLAILYRQKDRSDLIVKQLDPIISEIKDDQRALKYLAYALLDIGEPYRARSHFVELVRVAPEIGDYYLRVAECYAQEDTPEKAAAWLKLSTDHADRNEIETALLRPAFQRIAETRSMRLFRKSLEKDS